MGFKKVFHAVTITVIALLATAASAQARAAVNNSDLRLWSHNPRANGLARVWANEHLECAIVERRMLRHDLPNWAYPVGIHRPA